MLRCSFCKRSEDAVRKLIASHPSFRRVYICDECVAACNRILSGADDRSLSSAQRPSEEPPDPPTRLRFAITIL